MSKYDDVLNAALDEQINQWCERNEKSQAAMYEKVKDTLVSGMRDGYLGPLGRFFAWHGQDIIVHEYQTAVTQAVAYYREREVTALEVYNEVIKDAERHVRDGLQASSTGYFHNPVAQAVGRAAYDTVLDSHSNWQWLMSAAKIDARADLAPEGAINKANQIRATLYDLKTKKVNARAEHKAEQYQREIEANEANLVLVEAAIDAAVENAKAA